MNGLIILAALLPVCLGQGLGHVDVNTTQVAVEMFVDADTDHDGVMHMEELRAVFHKYDMNGDGRISRHEYTAYLGLHSPELAELGHYLYDEYDANHDHHLDEEDYVNFYRKMDLDGDDNVSEADFVEYWVDLLTSLKHIHPLGK